MKDSSDSFAAAAFWRYVRAVLLGSVLSLNGAADAGTLEPYEAPDLAAPGFFLKGLDGKPHRLEEYRGQVVLVNFWASWCPPCLAEMPSLQRLADQLAAEAFNVLAINVGESAFRAAKFLKLTGAVRLTVLLDETAEVFEAWGGNVYPTSFVLDVTGRIRYVAYGPLAWDSDDIVTALTGLLPSRRATAE